MKKLIISLLILPIALFAGDPIPGIGITVEQSPNGVTKKGKTNGRGEFIAKGLKEGDYKVTIEMNGVSCVIGDQVNEKITVPSSKSSARIKPIRLELSSKSMFISKVGNKFVASNNRDAASGLPTGKRQHKPMATSKVSGGGLSKADAERARGISSEALDEDSDNDGLDDDCNAVVEITPMKGGDLRVKIVGKK
jgi:hypothetical protein